MRVEPPQVQHRHEPAVSESLEVSAELRVLNRQTTRAPFLSTQKKEGPSEEKRSVEKKVAPSIEKKKGRIAQDQSPVNRRLCSYGRRWLWPYMVMALCRYGQVSSNRDYVVMAAWGHMVMAVYSYGSM